MRKSSQACPSHAFQFKTHYMMRPGMQRRGEQGAPLRGGRGMRRQDGGRAGRHALASRLRSIYLAEQGKQVSRQALSDWALIERAAVARAALARGSVCSQLRKMEDEARSRGLGVRAEMVHDEGESDRGIRGVSGIAHWSRLGYPSMGDWGGWLCRAAPPPMRRGLARRWSCQVGVC